jgi:hypothetical protein
MKVGTIGKRGSLVCVNIFDGTDEYNLNYICRYPKSMNIVYVCRFGPATDKYMGLVWLWSAIYICRWRHITDKYMGSGLTCTPPIFVGDLWIYRTITSRFVFPSRPQLCPTLEPFQAHILCAATAYLPRCHRRSPTVSSLLTSRTPRRSTPPPPQKLLETGPVVCWPEGMKVVFLFFISN